MDHIPDRKTPSKPRSFYERRYKAAARVYCGNKASIVRQNNHQIAKYVESVNPVPRNFIPPPKLKARDLIIDTGELHEEDLGKRYWLVRQSTPIGPRSRKVYLDLPGLYDIDKSLFSKGTLATLLSYHKLLNVRVVNRGSKQKESQSLDEADVAVSSGPAGSLGAEMEDAGPVTLHFFLKNGLESEELYTTPRAGRIVLKKLKLCLGSLGVEAIDAFEVSRKSKLAWTPVLWTSPIPAQPGDVVFF
ncbi:hypothetical protein BT96DRAFT_1007615 [Gymnopus androsaceus JB14]|uniref:Uncharacterized protein n=1 Tax=Gymnopus androsaceus JB14 TaxID=1447944 RepID=A0A6A4GH93_9AGAR|nr:hypothetical protein BT96DRAFT_1007615 [Gymnopus androsaceus JB14]